MAADNNQIAVLVGTDDADTIEGGNGRDSISGGAGADNLSGGNGRDELFGGSGRDTLNGGNGRDVLDGGLGVDVLTGGEGDDVFVFTADALLDTSSAVIPNVGGNTDIRARNVADRITDFTLGEDQIQLDVSSFGVTAPIVFATATASGLNGDANFIFLQGSFANVGQAARAIANNEAVTADAGFFVYFNSTLGLNRLVHSLDLSDGGQVTVLANFAGQGLDVIEQYSANDFFLI